MYVTPVERLLSALRAEFPEVEAVTKVPMKPPELFIRLDVNTVRPHTVASDETLVAVQVYGVDQERVINLIGQLRFFLLDEVYAHDRKILWWDEVSGPNEFPDPDDPEMFRWQIAGTLFTTLT